MKCDFCGKEMILEGYDTIDGVFCEQHTCLDYMCENFGIVVNKTVAKFKEQKDLHE